MAPGRVSVIQRSKTTGGSWWISLMKWSSSSIHPSGLSESEVVNGTKPSSSYSRHLMMNRVMCMREDDNCPAFSPAWCMINPYCNGGVCHDILNIYHLQKSVRKIDGSSLVFDVLLMRWLQTSSDGMTYPWWVIIISTLTMVWWYTIIWWICHCSGTMLNSRKYPTVENIKIF